MPTPNQPSHATPTTSRTRAASPWSVLLLIALAFILTVAIVIAATRITNHLSVQNSLLAQQNALIATQSELAAITAQSQRELDHAARRHDEIAKTLSESTSPAAQEHALIQLPEAMLIPVTIINPDWRPDAPSNIPRHTIIYPNLQSLAERLLIFTSRDRVLETIEGKQVPAASVSTAICRALHMLGYGEREPEYGNCIWDAIFDERGKPTPNPDERLHEITRRLLPSETKEATQLLAIDPHPHWGNATPISLRHIRGSQLLAARLQGAYLDEADLKGINLAFAQLQGARLGGAELQRATLSFAQLQGAYLSDAHLQGAELSFTQLQGANLFHAQLQGARLTEVNLHAANLGGAELQGAILSLARLQGADLTLARLQGTALWSAKLQGTRLTRAQLGSTPFILVLMKDGAHSYWRSSFGNPPGESILFPGSPASMSEISAGTVFALDIYESNTLDSSDRGRAFSIALTSGALTAAAWPTFEEAESAVRKAIGDHAVSWIIERTTDFTDADLTGVLIDQATLDHLKPGSFIPADAFKQAASDPESLEQRKSKPFRLPDPAEMIQAREAIHKASHERTPNASK